MKIIGNQKMKLIRLSKLSLTISINNSDSIKNISKFEEILSSIDLIYDFYILKFNNKFKMIL